MTTNDSHGWWSRLRHQGLLLSPVVMLERYPDAPVPAPFAATNKLRDAAARFHIVPDVAATERETLAWVDALLEGYLGHKQGRLAKQNDIPAKLTTTVRIGTRTETLRPHRVVFTDAESMTPALLVSVDTSPQVGRGRGRTAYARFLELLRGTGHRLGLLTNGRQFRLVYAGLDFESWCEWEAERWFDDCDGSEELAGLRLLLSPDSLKPVRDGVSGLLEAVEDSRKRQADLSSVLRENVRQAVELLLDEVSAANRTSESLFAPLFATKSARPLTDTEAHEALLQATVRVVMRLVVCLFAESRQLLPVNDPVYAASYGVRTLYEMLEEAVRVEGGTVTLTNREPTTWPRLMALFRLIHGGSGHGHFPLRAYGGALFRPGKVDSSDAVVRALHVLEHGVSVSDATVFAVLRKLLRGPLPVIRGKARTFVEGPVDYTDLRTEFIGLIYEGLLDYRLKRTDQQTGPQVFLNLGREPVLPLSRLTDMLANDKKGLKDLLTTLKKEKVTADGKGDEEAEEEVDDQEPADDEADSDEAPAEVEVETASEPEGVHGGDYLDAVTAAKQWASEAVVLAGLVTKQGKRETDTEYQARIGEVADKLIKRVVATGEFYLVRAGNTRKGTGTFYTRPQLAVPTAHRTLEPLCYDKAEDGTLTPKMPEVILGLKVCDPACGSASFLVAALHYLTDALYRSLCFHKKLDDPAEAKKLTLPHGRAREGKVDEELVPFSPDDPQRGETFADRVKALLRRHVVERCIYGVDINPLAVEFARVSLWVETLDPELPFSFLNHKVKVGNALVGCWLDRVPDYPLCAWEREGGDGKDGPRTQRIETLLKGPKVGNRRSGDGVVKKEMRDVLNDIRNETNKTPTLFNYHQLETEKVITAARADYEKLHELPVQDPDEREAYYRDHVENSEPVRRLKAAMDEWCAVWFWPTDEERFKHVPLPMYFLGEDVDKAAITRRVAAEMKFFHWEVEFSDVFTKDRRGFDALLGNPPWDVMKPNSQEFFTEFDPLYRTYDKQAALRRQKELFDTIPRLQDQWDDYNARFKGLSNWAGKVAEPFNVTLARGGEEKSLKAAWEKHRQQNVGFADPAHPFHLQGSADLNSYKMFAEVFWHLLRSGGRLGVILPTGIYSDFGTKDLRETLLTKGRIDFLYAFQNEKKVFAGIDHRYKQVALFVTRGGSTRGFLTRFRMGVGNSPYAHELPDDLLNRDYAAMSFTPDDVKRNSPKAMSLVELASERDLTIFRTIYDHSIRIGDNTPGWEITYATEFHMTNDSKHFPPLEKWEAKGFKPDVFGRWIGPNDEVALPLYQGGMINQFDSLFKSWEQGMGRSAEWREVSHDFKSLRPKFCMARDWFIDQGDPRRQLKIVFRNIARSTDTRSFIASIIEPLPTAHSLSVLALPNAPTDRVIFVGCVSQSLVFDYVLRTRLSGTNLSLFIIEECPLPQVTASDSRYRCLALAAACLTFIHRPFAPEWLQLRQRYPELAGREWKHWWAVTETDRLRLRVEIDALCADLYGLTPDDFDWIVRDDPTDPKGFYRVDRQLPFRERLTGLAAAAFRALKAGKWSADSAATMTNDEFFAAIGIPEMTTGDEPLIRKRDGCHRWKPEEFGPDDPRHGWTWEDCQKDAVALLGSEDAVRKYVELKAASKQPTIASSSPQPQSGLFDLEAEIDFADPSEAFLNDVGELDRGQQYDRALDQVFSRFDACFRRGDFPFADAVLRAIDVDRFSLDTLIGFLTVTLSAKDRLAERAAFFSRVANRVNRSHTPQEAQRILGGLE